MDCINSIDQWSKQGLEDFFRSVWLVKNNLATVQGRIIAGQTLGHVHATLFFDQPSTRTKMSFMHACRFLGMQTYYFDGGRSSSTSKGESIRDTYRTLGAYSDLLIVRSGEENLVSQMQEDFRLWGYKKRIIQAGGGSEFHPTQALLDLYTLWERSFQGKSASIDEKTFALIGDLRFGRAIKSLLRGLQVLGAKKVYLVSKQASRLPSENKDVAEQHGLALEQTGNLDGIIQEADVFYIPRMQSEYDKSQGLDGAVDQTTETKPADFILTPALLGEMKPDSCVMSPLPRLQELPEELDTDQRAIYWEQEKNGLWVRIALLKLVCKDLISKNKIEEFGD